MVEPRAHESHGAAFGVHFGGCGEMGEIACLGHWQRSLGGNDGFDFKVGEGIAVHVVIRRRPVRIIADLDRDAVPLKTVGLVCGAHRALLLAASAPVPVAAVVAAAVVPPATMVAMAVMVVVMMIIMVVVLSMVVVVVMDQYSEASMMVRMRKDWAGSAGFSEPVAQDLSA